MSPEAADKLSVYILHHKLNEYLSLIRESKKVCDIPVIASINCYKDDVWADFAKQIEEAGADALEINILALQTDVQYTYGSFEQRHIDILRHIKKTVKIPVIMKLGSNLTNPVALIDQLYANGAAAVVLFNRFYQPDINIDKMTQVAGNVFSNESDLANSLRWTGIASAAVSKIDYAISGGIHSAEGVVKAILAGASAVEICSVLYKESSAVINEYFSDTVYTKFGESANDALEAGPKVGIYPNPARSMFHIETGEACHASIFSADGKKILSRELTAGKHEFSLEGQTKGIYLISIETAGGTVFRKLILQ